MIQTRKKVRFENYDYSENGAYFITICTQNKVKIFWNDNVKIKSVGADIIRPQSTYVDKLSEYGKIVYNSINKISDYYEYAVVDKFVVMPNHIHMILKINKYHMENGRIISAPTKSISTIIGMLKQSITKQIGKSVWQRSFYDHIIRDENDYLTKWNYIDTNPQKWEFDEYF